MNILPILLIFIPFLTSILTLTQDRYPEKKWRIGNLLAIAYLIALLFGIIQSFLDQASSDRIFGNILSISKNVAKIDTASKKLLSKIDSQIVNSDTLILRAKTMNKQLESIISARDSLLYQSTKLNENLRRQLSIDSLNLVEGAPELILANSDLKWFGSDSTTLLIIGEVSNVGKRRAVLDFVKCAMVIFNSDKQPNHYYENNAGMVVANEILDNKTIIDFRTPPINAPMSFFEKQYIVVYCLTITYHDQVTFNRKTSTFFYAWTKALNDFSLLRPWQKDLLLQLLNEQGFFSPKKTMLSEWHKN